MYFLRYIGSKLNLIENIEDFIEKQTDGTEKSFLDLFAGSNIVAAHFKQKYEVYTNDLLYFSFVLSKAKIENNNPLNFEKLSKIGIKDPLNYLQNNEITYDNIGYYEKSYSPTGDKMYFTVENAKRIDFIRDTLEFWKSEELISEEEYYYLLASLIEAIPFISNITGTYGAFLKHWDKRAIKKLILKPINVVNNEKNNISHNEDSNELVKKLSADIVYLDPPYNKRQYAPNYHVLENIARNNKPILKGVTNLFDYKSLKSKYSIQKQAYVTLENLLENIDTTHIFLSYNNEGIIPEDDLINLLKKHSIDGKVTIKKIPYRKYKSKKPSNNYDLYELLLHIRCKKKSESKVNNSNKIITSPTTWEIPKKNYLKSPLNYIGGKYKLLPQILPLFPKYINNFVDLFSGGANVGINVPAKYHYFNDMNHHIIEMFKYFSQQDPQKLVNSIEARIAQFNLSKTNEEAYIKFRKQYNANQNPIDLYILISYSYNYQIRFNNSMEFNNPFGRNRSHFSKNMKNNLVNFVKRLNELNVSFTNNYFSELDFSGLKDGDFVYLDPPYLITTGSYNDGNRGFKNWTIQQEKSMYQLMKTLTEQNVRYALSNVLNHKGKSNDLLKDFINNNNVVTHHLNYNYSNSSYNSKNVEGSDEVLITNYDSASFEILK